MSHVMLDLETLDTASSAVILSIGAVWFDERGLHGNESGADEFYRVLPIDEQIAKGRTTSPDTIEFWSQQDPETRHALEAHAKTPVLDALLGLEVFLLRRSLDGVWGNGADFDNALISSLATSFGTHVPWKHRHNRCYRTLRALFPDIEMPEVEGIQHHALDDAKAQAMHAANLLAFVKHVTPP